MAIQQMIVELLRGGNATALCCNPPNSVGNHRDLACRVALVWHPNRGMIPAIKYIGGENGDHCRYGIDHP